MAEITIILVRPKISGNIGAVARSMANLGFERLMLIEPCKIDEEAKNRAKHAQKILKKAKKYKTLNQAIKKHDLNIATTGIIGTDYNIIRTPVSPEELKQKLEGKKGKISIIFGPEDQGLSNEELKQCDFTVTIPTDKKYPVINLSHAVTIILYELSKTKEKETTKLATKREMQELHKILEELINKTKFKTEDEKNTQKLVWQRIMGKSMPTKREAYAIIGFLKKLK